MNASEIIAVAAAVLAALLAGVLIAVLASLAATLRALRAALTELTDVTLPAVDELRDAVDATASQVERVDRLITSAEGLEERVDSATRLAYRALQSPVVKAMALGAGVNEAGKRLRGRAAGPAPIEPPARRRARRRADR